jgi:hypothetical protein
MPVVSTLGCEPTPSEPQSAVPDQVGPTVRTDLVTIRDQAWSAPEPNELIVATVNGQPITEGVIEALRAAQPELSVDQLIQRAVEVELLAQQSRASDPRISAAVNATWKQALARQLLKDVFEVRVGPDSLPIEQVRKLYNVPRVRKLYDHEDAWRMAHVFFTCCDPKVERCDTDYVMRCFTESGEMIQSVYRELKHQAQDVEGNPDALVSVMEKYRADNEMRFMTHPFAFRTRPFYYDPETPHEEQSGYNIIAEVVARTVIDGDLAVLQPPVQSAFGWHVIAKLDHIPERRLGPDDPFVISDIRANMLPSVREARFKGFLEGLRASGAPQVNFEPLALLNPRGIGAP